MKITGELLRAERLNQKLSVSDVAQSLKLTIKVINAIENGQLENLPAKTFVRGFVRGYAEFLKLDYEVVLRQFQEEMGSTTPLPKVPPPMGPSAPVPSEPIKSMRPALKQTSQNFQDNTASVRTAPLQQNSNKSIIIMVAGAVGLIIVLVISNKIISHFENTPVAPPTVAVLPAENPATPTVPTPITPESPGPEISVESTVQAVAAEAVAPPAPNVPEGGFAKSSEKPVEILLEAKKDIELYYAKGNARQFNSLKLSANQVHVLRSKTGLYLKAADGSAFKISVNGIDQGLAGAPNKEVKLSY